MKFKIKSGQLIVKTLTFIIFILAGFFLYFFISKYLFRGAFTDIYENTVTSLTFSQNLISFLPFIMVLLLFGYKIDFIIEWLLFPIISSLIFIIFYYTINFCIYPHNLFLLELQNINIGLYELIVAGTLSIYFISLFILTIGYLSKICVNFLVDR